MLVRPTLDLHFAQARFPDPRITFSRPTTATYTDALGRVRTAGANAPRFDYDPVTGQSLGLLIEESRTNLLRWSESFITSGRPWTALRCSVSETTKPSPVEGGNYWALTEDSSSDVERYLEQPLSISAGVYSYSLSAKSLSGNRHLWIRTSGAGGFGTAVIDIETGAVIATSSGAAAVSVEPQADGGYRIAVSGESPGGTVLVRVQLRSKSGGSAYTGDGVSGLLFTAAQLEQGTAPTSYIPTLDAPVTRAADTPHIEAGDWFNPSEGTFVVKFRPPPTSGGGYVFGMDTEPASSLNRLGVRDDGFFFTVTGGGQVVSGTAPGFIPGGVNIVAVSLDRLGWRACSNGVANVLSRANEGFPQGLSRLRIGHRGSSGPNYLNSHISRLFYFPRALDAAALQRLTEVPA